MKTSNLDEILPRMAKGGAWITPDGHYVPVADEAEHISTLRANSQLDWYDEAYEKGWIHTRFRTYEGEFSASFDRKHATIPALKALTQLLRHPHASANKSFFLAETGEEYQSWPKDDPKETASPADLMARHVMKLVLKKNAEAKRQAQQLEMAA